MDKFYNIIPTGPGQFDIVDFKTGIVLNKISLQGEIASGPVVIGSKCTVIMQDPDSSKTGYILNLPDGNIFNKFVI